MHLVEVHSCRAEWYADKPTGMSCDLSSSEIASTVEYISLQVFSGYPRRLGLEDMSSVHKVSFQCSSELSGTCCLCSSPASAMLSYQTFTACGPSSLTRCPSGQDEKLTFGC